MKRQSERNTEIAERRSEGYTLAEIGDCYGISKERVRQILTEQFPETKRGMLSLDELANAVGWSAMGVWRLLRRLGMTPTRISMGGMALYSPQFLAELQQRIAERKCRICGRVLPSQRFVYCSGECRIAGWADRNRTPESRARHRSSKRQYMARVRQYADVSER